MGYTHYLYQPSELDREKFRKWSSFVKVLIEKSPVAIRGWDVA